MTAAFSRRGRPPRKRIDREIAALDPVADSAQIMRLIDARLTPRIGAALLRNLFYAWGFMRIAGQIEGARAVDRAGTGKIYRHPDIRAEETLAHFTGWTQHGASSAAGVASLDQVKSLHERYARRYAMSNETFVHTIALFTVQFEHLFALVGAPGFTGTEKAAQVEHWRTIGEHLGARELPASWDGMERALRDYESSPRWFGRTPEARRCADAFIDQFADRWLSRPLRWVARPLLLSLHENHVIDAVGHQRPARPVVALVRGAVRGLLFINRRLLADQRELLDPSLDAHSRP